MASSDGRSIPANRKRLAFITSAPKTEPAQVRTQRKFRNASSAPIDSLSEFGNAVRIASDAASYRTAGHASVANLPHRALFSVFFFRMEPVRPLSRFHANGLRQRGAWLLRAR